MYAYLSLIYFVFLIKLVGEYKLWRGLVYRFFLHPPVTSSLYGRNISSAPCSSLDVRDQDSHSYNTTSEIIDQYLEQDGETKHIFCATHFFHKSH
jgi:hypothetical protein